MRWALIASFALLTAVTAVATLGVFRGKLVEPPPQHHRTGWIFVQSPKGMVRQVEISKAKIVYGDDVPSLGRSSLPKGDLIPGTEVLVTAEQDDGGEWRATEVEILSLGSRHASAKPRAGRLPSRGPAERQ